MINWRPPPYFYFTGFNYFVFEDDEIINYSNQPASSYLFVISAIDENIMRQDIFTTEIVKSK